MDGCPACPAGAPPCSTVTATCPPGWSPWSEESPLLSDESELPPPLEDESLELPLEEEPELLSESESELESLEESELLSLDESELESDELSESEPLDESLESELSEPDEEGKPELPNPEALRTLSSLGITRSPWELLSHR